MNTKKKRKKETRTGFNTYALFPFIQHITHNPNRILYICDTYGDKKYGTQHTPLLLNMKLTRKKEKKKKITFASSTAIYIFG